MITNCPNCGAPVSGLVCEYCGTRFSFEENKTVLLKNGNLTTDYTKMLKELKWKRGKYYFVKW